MAKRLVTYLLIAGLVLSFTSHILSLLVAWGIVIVEITPDDLSKMGNVSINIGDRVKVWGVWVRDKENMIYLGGWNEIHPARYLKVLGKELEYGTMEYVGRLMEGVYNPSRLRVIDPTNPYRLLVGEVMNVFKAPDGDLHVHIKPDPSYTYLSRGSFLFHVPINHLYTLLLIGVGISFLSLLLIGWGLIKRKFRLGSST